MERKYVSLMIKRELKEMMNEKIGSLKMKMSYSELIVYLLEKDKNPQRVYVALKNGYEEMNISEWWDYMKQKSIEKDKSGK